MFKLFCLLNNPIFVTSQKLTQDAIHSGSRAASLRKLIFSLLLCGLLFPGCAAHNKNHANMHSDVVLDVIPLQVRALSAENVIDVLETDDPEIMPSQQSVVTMSIKKVVEGTFTLERRGGGSKLEQMGDAVDGKSILKLVTLDFHDPDELVEKQWLNIALANPLKTFGINNWEAPASETFRIYLARNADHPASYVLRRAEALSAK